MSLDLDLDSWGALENRPRDLADTISEKADCCWDKARYIAEISRKRNPGVHITPARFRLCAHHAAILARTDPDAGVFPIARTEAAQAVAGMQ